MSGFKHTEGPWAFQKRAFVGRVHPANDSSRSIATVYRHKKANKIKRYHDDEESTANGLLITATPEMLDIGLACKKYAQPYENESGVIVIKMPLGVYAKAIQTIERATGMSIDKAIKVWEARND